MKVIIVFVHNADDVQHYFTLLNKSFAVISNFKEIIYWTHSRIDINCSNYSNQKEKLIVKYKGEFNA